MWYEQLINSLLIKVTENERVYAGFFLNSLFRYLDVLMQQPLSPNPFLSQIDNMIAQSLPINAEDLNSIIDENYGRSEPRTMISFSNIIEASSKKYGPAVTRLLLNVLNKKYPAWEPLPFELVLGLVQHMFARYETIKDNSVRANNFCKYLLALAMIYSKISVDDMSSINNSKFHPFISMDIFNILGLSLYRYSAQSIKNSVNDLERLILKRLDYSTGINFDKILDIIYRQRSPELIDAMTSYFSFSRYCSFPHIVESNDKFGRFVMELYQVKTMIEREKAVAYQHSFSFFPLESLPTPQPKQVEKQVPVTNSNSLFAFDLFAGIRPRKSDEDDREAMIKANNFN